MKKKQYLIQDEPATTFEEQTHRALMYKVQEVLSKDADLIRLGFTYSKPIRFNSHVLCNQLGQEIGWMDIVRVDNGNLITLELDERK